MNSKWIFGLIGFVALIGASSSFAQVKSAAPAKSTPAAAKAVPVENDEAAADEPLPTWAQQKENFKKLEAKFRNKSLTTDAKVKLLPQSNALLSETQDIKMDAKEKAEQIATVVKFLSATIEADFANSNTNTIYFDYKANQKAYDAEIAKIPSKEAQKKIQEAFKDWAEFEKDAEKPESESADE